MIEAPQDLSAALGPIRETLEKSNFPYKVDLIQLSEFVDAYRSGFEHDKKAFIESNF